MVPPEMRSRELRLERAFRSIVVAVLASPVASAVACSATESGGKDGPDATVGASSDAAGAGDGRAVDGSEADAGGGADADATVSQSEPHDASADREGCLSRPFDGAAIEGSQDGCVQYGLLPCGLPPTAQREGCVVDLATCTGLAAPIDAGFYLYCQLAPISCDDAGNVLDAESVIQFISCNGITGRRPLGLRPERVATRGPLADYFTAMAHLESASVTAFRDLSRWLTGFGAPLRLSRAAGRSAEEERRHARAAQRLARRFGGGAVRPRVRRFAAPSLAAVLEDDAVEGCVHEAFGALLASWQADQASDARLRRTMRRIAADERRHAALAWEVLGWGVARLTREERERVFEAFERAVSALEAGALAPVHPAVRPRVGYPEREHERLLAHEFARLARAELGAYRDREPS
jgi:hypothetical protein